MAKNTGKDFEKFVYEIFMALSKQHPATKISQNEIIESLDGSRECDILIRHEMAQIPYLTVVECRDFSRRLNITTIDAFSSKMADIKANRGILVSRNGFSKSAKRKADRLGIMLCVADKANSIKPEFVQAVPVVARKVSAVRIAIGEKFASAGSNDQISLYSEIRVNGIPAMEILFNSFERGIVRSVKDHPIFSEWKEHEDFIVDLREYFGGTEVTIPRPDGTKFVFDNGHLLFKIQEDWYFGHTSNLELAANLVDLTNRKNNLVIYAADFLAMENIFKKYDSVEAMPRYGQIEHLLVVVVDMTIPISKISSYIKKATHPSSTPR